MGDAGGPEHISAAPAIPLSLVSSVSAPRRSASTTYAAS